MTMNRRETKRWRQIVRSDLNKCSVWWLMVMFKSPGRALNSIVCNHFLINLFHFFLPSLISPLLYPLSAASKLPSCSCISLLDFYISSIEFFWYFFAASIKVKSLARGLTLSLKSTRSKTILLNAEISGLNSRF